MVPMQTATFSAFPGFFMLRARQAMDSGGLLILTPTPQPLFHLVPTFTRMSSFTLFYFTGIFFINFTVGSCNCWSIYKNQICYNETYFEIWQPFLNLTIAVDISQKSSKSSQLRRRHFYNNHNL